MIVCSFFFVSTVGSTGVSTTAAHETIDWYESSRQTAKIKKISVLKSEISSYFKRLKLKKKKKSSHTTIDKSANGLVLISDILTHVSININYLCITVLDDMT